MSAVVHKLFPSAEADPAAVAFEAVWKLWPRRDGKAVARAKYLSIVKGGYVSKTLDKSSGQFLELELSASPAEIEAGVRAYVDSQIDKRTFRFRDDGKYVPHLSTWLGRGGWMDFE